MVKWLNKCLIEAMLKIESLKELSNGVLLVQLLQILFKNEDTSALKSYCKAPKLRVQKLTNIALALKFLNSQLVVKSNSNDDNSGDNNNPLKHICLEGV